MAIALRIEHVDGIRLRQQIAQTATRNDEGYVLAGTNWVFEKEPGAHKDAVIPLDLDPRTQKPTNTYSVVINYGLKNLVIERQGPAHQAAFRNSSVRNQLRIRYQQQTPNGRTHKDGTAIKEWKDSGSPQYLAPQTWGGVAVGDGTRAILDEMPT